MTIAAMDISDTREADPEAQKRAIAIIPCLNEAQHIERLISMLHPAAERLKMRMVVVDGGSTDGTLKILERLDAGNPRLVVLHNEKRIQSAAVNTAVREFGEDATWLIRIDAHADYPPDFCDRLIEEAEATGADSIVVAMVTEGHGAFQRATALAQNSRLGNGGAKHRDGAEGQWTDHGHHALMSVEAFCAVGGYDENFRHNEDAELDFRLRRAGYRIWLTDKTKIFYYPRDTAWGLFRQYLNYGKGRARNILKHRSPPKIRQMVPAMVLPATAGASLALVHWTAAVPIGVWVAICLGYGISMGVGHRDPRVLLTGLSVMIMHFAWSAGFWLHVIAARALGRRMS